ncbi:hypothetical protein ACFE04_001744 [Oxalis oulophora]
MVNIRVSDRQKTAAPAGAAEVGEIDTRAPFRSVKAAVSLFGDVAVSRDKRPTSPRKSKQSSENVIDKETQLLLTETESNKIMRRLNKAEATRSQALYELDKAKKTLQDLTSKLQDANESKRSVIEATQVVRVKAKQLEHAKSQKQLGNEVMEEELDNARKNYSSIANELDAAKQELNTFRQDFDSAFDAKFVAIQHEDEAQRTANVHSEKVSELQKEIANMRETIQHLKFAMIETQEECSQIWGEKADREESYRNSKEEAHNKLVSLKSQYDPELTRNLELKFAETTAEIEKLKVQMRRAYASKMKVLKVISAELNEATKILQQLKEEESSLRSLVSALKLELEKVMKEREELERVEREKYLAEIDKLTSESGKVRAEAEKLKKNAEILKQEAENDRTMKEEFEKMLQLAISEAEEAKKAEVKACEEMRVISETNKNENNQDSPREKIRVSAEDFKSLQKKIEESVKMADEKVAEAESTMHEINARKENADETMEEYLKAIEEINTATNIALESANQAETAKTMVEGELKKWREDQGVDLA